jgi:hypothetical protein
MASWLKADGTVVVVKPARGMFTLAELHGYVGDPIDIVRPHLDGYQHLFLVCNDNGKLLGLPVNQRATEIYAHPGIPQAVRDNPNIMVWGTEADFALMVGDVLLCDDTEID